MTDRPSRPDLAALDAQVQHVKCPAFPKACREEFPTELHRWCIRCLLLAYRDATRAAAPDLAARETETLEQRLRAQADNCCEYENDVPLLREAADALEAKDRELAEARTESIHKAMTDAVDMHRTQKRAEQAESNLAAEKAAHDDCARGFHIYQREAEAREDALRSDLAACQRERDELWKGQA